jgi:hypothetical protein
MALTGDKNSRFLKVSFCLPLDAGVVIRYSFRIMQPESIKSLLNKNNIPMFYIDRELI